MKNYRPLIKAAQSVIDNWETGDLAQAVRELQEALQDVLGEEESWEESE